MSIYPILQELPRADALDYLVYILFFPKLIMGPLMDPVDFITQLNDTSLRRPSAENIAAGVKLFSFGLFKKLLLADTFAKAVAWGFANTETATAADWLLVMLFYSLKSILISAAIPTWQRVLPSF